MLLLLLLIIGFVVLSGVLALVEAAVLSVTRAEVEVMVAKKLPGAIALRTIKRNITRAVVIIVIFTNIINVLGPILVGIHAVEIYGSNIIGVITGILTFGTIVFSEILPKSLGSHHAPRISRIVAPGILALIGALFPVVWVLEHFVGSVKRGRRRVGTEEQIRSLVRLGTLEGHIETDEDQLIHRAFILNDRCAKDIMTPRSDVISVREDQSIREVADVILKQPYSRYPLLSEDGQSVLGLVLSRDVLQTLSEGKDARNIKVLRREILTVDEDMRADDLLSLLRKRKVHMAVVQGDNAMLGVVTLEDVIEELVGEIEDEIDSERAGNNAHNSLSQS